jgi:hypothetical protein
LDSPRRATLHRVVDTGISGVIRPKDLKSGLSPLWINATWVEKYGGRDLSKGFLNRIIRSLEAMRASLACADLANRDCSHRECSEQGSAPLVHLFKGEDSKN